MARACLLGSVMARSVRSRRSAGDNTPSEGGVRLLRALAAGSGAARAVGKVDASGIRTATVDGRHVDGEGRHGRGTLACRLFGLRPVSAHGRSEALIPKRMARRVVQ